MKKDHPSRLMAFTVLELLVVAGLMVVVLMLMFPAIGAVRERVNSATCASQVRTIVAAILRHAAENNGYLISAWETPYKEETYWANQLGAYLGYPLTTQRLGRDYLVCPTQKASREDLPFGTYGVHYTAGGAAKPLFAMRRDGGRLTHFRATTMLVGDAAGLIYSPSVWKLNSADGLSSNKHAAPYNQALFPHHDRMMAGFVDGSVRSLSLEDWKNGAGELKLQ